MGTAVWRKLRIKVMTSPNSFDELGFILIFIGLHRYRQIARKIKEHDGIDPIPSRLVTVLIVLLQLALLVVLAAVILG